MGTNQQMLLAQKIAAGGGGASITFEFGESDSDAAAASSMSVARTVTTGRAYFIFVSWEGAGTVTGITSGAGTFTALTQVTHGVEVFKGRWFYLLSATTGGAQTFVPATTGTCEWAWMHVAEFSYSGGTAAIDDEGTAGTGNSTSPASGSITTTGTVATMLGGCALFGSRTWSSPLCSGSAATFITTPGSQSGAAWYRILSSTTTGTVAATIDTSVEWVIRGASFKVT